MREVKLLFLLLFCNFSMMAQTNNQLIVNLGKNANQNNIQNRKEKGFYNIMQFSLLMGKTQTFNNALSTGDYQTGLSSFVAPSPYYYRYPESKLAVIPSFTITNGYMFNKNWAAGIGIGYEIFDHNLFPLFGEIRYTLWDSKISPVIAVKGGYSIASLKEKSYKDLYLNWEPYYVNNSKLKHYGGLMLHPEVGVKIPISVNSDLLISAAYRFQKIKSIVNKTYENNSFDEWEHKEDLNRLSVGVAVQFR